MDAVSPDQRLGAFRATDAFALEAYRLAGGLRGGGAAGLADEIRRSAVTSGGAIVAASASARGSEAERLHLERARTALMESRYYLYVARRFAMLDPKTYRALAARQDSALRELEGVLGPVSAPRATRPP